MGYSYTGKGEILDKLTPEDHSGWGLEKAANFIKEQREKYNYSKRKENTQAWMMPQQQEDLACEEQQARA